MTTQSPAEQYREYVELFLQQRELTATSRCELLMAICSGRAVLNFSGQTDRIAGEEQMLARLTAGNLRLVVEATKLGEFESRLARFVRVSEDNGADVSLIEPEREAEALQEEGRRLLWERHDIECQLEGLAWIAEERHDLRAEISPELQALRERLTKIDDRWKADIRHFLSFNGFRRQCRGQYPDEQRFWWWSLNADCDLAAVYRAADRGTAPSSHLRACLICSAIFHDLEAVDAALDAAKGLIDISHPEPEDIVRLFDGEVGGEEEQALEWHVRTCPRCQWEIEALERAEEAKLGWVAAAVEQAKMSEPGEPVVYTYTVFDVPLRVAADTADRADDIRALPGEFVCADGDIKVWINQKGRRVVMHVIGDDLRDLGSLELTDADSLDVRDVEALTKDVKEVQFDVGDVGEVAGKRLLLSLEYEGRALRLPRLDLRLA